MTTNCEKVFTNCRSANAYNHKHHNLYHIQVSYPLHKDYENSCEQFSRLLPLNIKGVGHGEKS